MINKIEIYDWVETKQIVCDITQTLNRKYPIEIQSDNNLLNLDMAVEIYNGTARFDIYKATNKECGCCDGRNDKIESLELELIRLKEYNECMKNGLDAIKKAMDEQDRPKVYSTIKKIR